MQGNAIGNLLSLFTAVIATVLLACGCTRGPDEPGSPDNDVIELTFGGNWPPSHPMSLATRDWIDRIEKETGGRVRIKAFWASGLYGAKESALELAKGVADIGDLSGAYAPRGFDFEKSMRMAFWGLDDPQAAREIYYSALRKYPQLEQEFTDANIKVMAYASIPPYQLLLANRRVTSTEDLKGLTLKATGDLADLAAAFGAEGIVMPMGESYMALQKTTIDGVFAPYEILQSFRLGEVAHYAVKLDISAAPAGHWGFNLDSWNRLPQDIRQVFLDNREWFGARIEELVFAKNETGMVFGKENGVEFITLSDAELEKVYAVVDRTIRAQMADLDSRGLPGTEVYEYIRGMIDERRTAAASGAGIAASNPDLNE